MEARKLHCWEDLFELPGFVDTVPSEMMKAGTLSQPYSMPEKCGERKCGISECGTPHRNGYVICLEGGGFSHVGQHCGRKHFGATNWKVQLRNLRQRRKAAAAAEALEQAKQRARAAIAGASNKPQGLDHALALLSLFDCLPGAFRYELERRASTGQAEIFQLRDPTEADVKRAKFFGQQRPKTVKVSVGVIADLAAVSPTGRIESSLSAVARLTGQLADRLHGEEPVTLELVELTNRLQAVTNRLPAEVARTLRFFSAGNIAELSKIPEAPAFESFLTSEESNIVPPTEMP